MDPQLFKAKQDFQRARQQAKLQEIVARLTGKPVNLLVFDEVRDKLKAVEGAGRQLENIPIHAIVGSVGRYNDFNREFLPLRSVNQDRWARVKVVMEDLSGLPPIEAYQVGEAYFVSDGNHRVSIARRLGATEIEGYVKTVHTRVPLPANARQEDLILLSEYANFLDQTRLDELRPDANLRLTEAGQYDFLLQQIEVQHFMMELQSGEPVLYENAVCQWYDDLYLPLANLIRARNVLKDFPHRTEADFFVWVLDHQARISKEAGWRVRADAALTELAEKVNAEADSFASRIRNAVLDAFNLVRADAAPAGQWREEHLQRPGRLFGEIIVPLFENIAGFSLTCALEIARYENAQVYALHLSASELTLEQQARLQTQFDNLCQQANVEGELIFEKGKPDVILPERSRWVDLIIASIEPDSPSPAGNGTVSPTFHSLIQHSHTPILALPPYEDTTPFIFPARALLAYDSSKKAEEALFLATYLSSFWELELVVMSVIPDEPGHPPSAALAYTEEYLRNYQIEAKYCHAHGDVANEILRAVEDHNCDLILMGGYGVNPVFGGFRKRTVDEVLSKTKFPVFVCR